MKWIELVRIDALERRFQWLKTSAGKKSKQCSQELFQCKLSFSFDKGPNLWARPLMRSEFQCNRSSLNRNARYKSADVERIN